MKKPFVSIAVAGAALSGAQVAVIPQPNSIQPAEGSFELNRATRIAVSKDTEAVGELARSYFSPPTGFDLPLTREAGANTIDLKLDRRLAALGEEGYRLTVKKDRIEVRALKPAGAFYGVQTLRQLFPADIFRKAPASRTLWTVGCVQIEDGPRFGWRGAMIDSARHFMPKEFILKYLDVMALHKLNRFHIHLTDDTGWRIEIKRFPGLTGRSSNSDFSEMNPKGATRSINQKPGGYYTQDDIREIVAYAAKRFITVIPEIEMPGHAKAAIDAYPELGNLSQILQFGDKSKSDIWNNVFNVEEDTIKFLKQVLDEVLDLFPSPWIHIGGDEVDKTPWKNNPKAQEKMAAVGAKDEHELQSWFVKQFDEYLTSKGRRLIGWDEILEGGLAPKATVMSWRGMDGGIAAAKAKHEVVMAPTTYTYLDYYQAKPTALEPKAIGGYLPLEMVYTFEPVPPELSAEEAKYILGGQFQLWTEFIPHPRHLEYMTFPRGCAVAEVVWSKKELRNYPDFLVRLKAQLERFKIMDVNFRPLDEPLKVAGSWQSGQVSGQFEVKEWDLSAAISQPNDYRILFQFTGGAHRLDIEWVEVLVDGMPQARVEQKGMTGAQDRANIYDVRLKQVGSGSKVTLRASVRADGGTDSNGNIYVIPGRRFGDWL